MPSVGDIRRVLGEGYFEFADAAKTVAAMIATIDSDSPPFRLVLGKPAYESIRTSLMKQIESLGAQKEIALSVMEET